MRPRWLRFAHAELRPLLYLPQQPSYNKRLRRLVATLHGLPVGFALTGAKGRRAAGPA